MLRLLAAIGLTLIVSASAARADARAALPASTVEQREAHDRARARLAALQGSGSQDAKAAGAAPLSKAAGQEPKPKPIGSAAKKGTIRQEPRIVDD